MNSWDKGKDEQCKEMGIRTTFGHRSGLIVQTDSIQSMAIMEHLLSPVASPNHPAISRAPRRQTH